MFGMPLLDAFRKLPKASISFIMSVCLSIRPSAWNNSAPTGLFFVKFYSGDFN
jgi:hypothetical protein